MSNEQQSSNQAKPFGGLELIAYLESMGLNPSITDEEKATFQKVAEAYKLKAFKRENQCSVSNYSFPFVAGLEAFVPKSATETKLGKELTDWQKRTTELTNVVQEYEDQRTKLKAIEGLSKADLIKHFSYLVEQANKNEIAFDGNGGTGKFIVLPF